MKINENCAATFAIKKKFGEPPNLIQKGGKK
jgi:hypothetical protein